MTNYPIVDFYIKAYNNNIEGFAIIKAIEVKKGNNVLYVHKFWTESSFDYNNAEYKPKRKGKLYKYAISHKSGFALDVNIQSPNIYLVIKLVEKLLKKKFFGFWFHYKPNAYNKYKYEVYYHSGLWKYRENKVNNATKLVYDMANKMMKGLKGYAN